MMKLTTNLIEKVGADRVIHFLLAMNIVQYITYIDSSFNFWINLIYIVVANGIVFGLSKLKEYVFDKKDSKPDETDIKAAMYGCLTIDVILIVTNIIKYL